MAARRVRGVPCWRGGAERADATLPNIGQRWRELILPIHQDKAKARKISRIAEEAIRKKWQAQDDIQNLRNITQSPIVT